MNTLFLAALLALPARAADPAAVLGPVFGSSQYQLGDSDAWFFVKPGRALPAGAMLRTEAGAFCLIFLSDGTKLRLWPKSHLRVVELSAERSELALASGRMEVWVKKRGKAQFKAQTPLFTAAQAEGVFAVEILSENSAVLDLFAGDTDITDEGGQTRMVSAGNRVEFAAKTGASTPVPLPAIALRSEEPSEAGPARPTSAQQTAAEPAPKPATPAAPKPAAPAVVKSTAAAPAPKAPEAAPQPKTAAQELDTQL